MREEGRAAEVAERFRILLENPDDPAVKDWAPDRLEFDLLLRLCLAESISDPVKGEDWIDTALPLALNRCQTAQGWGLKARCQRAQGRLEEARNTLRIIRDGFAVLCVACDADCDRREAAVFRDLRLFPEALKLADNAIVKYRNVIQGPGHDLDGNGLASSYRVRASIHSDAGNLRQAIADAGTALSLTSHTASPQLYRITIFNLAGFLFLSGEPADLELADRYIRQARRFFSGVRRPSQEGAKLTWLTVMVRSGLRTMQPVRVRKYLRRCQQDFIALSMPQEALAVAADAARIAYPDRDRVCEAAQNLSDDLKSRSVSLPAHLRGVAARFRAMGTTEDWLDQETVRVVIEGLREACGPQMLPCLVKW